MYPYREWTEAKKYRHTFYSEQDAVNWQRYLKKHGIETGIYKVYKWDEQATTWTVSPVR